MRVVVIQETDWVRRGPHQQHHLFERLSLRGHEITVLDYPILRAHWPREPFWNADAVNENAARIYPGARIKVITPGTSGVMPLARISSVGSHHRVLKRVIEEERPDVMVCYALSTGMPALRLARKYGIPFVFHVIDALHAIVPVRMLQPIAHAVERRIFAAADEVLLINDHLRDYAIGMGAKVTSTHVLRTGVDLERFHPGLDGSQARTELGIGKDEPVLFFMGWIYSFSGVREVAESLKDAPDHVRLLVVGDGDDYAALCAMQPSLGKRLIMTGRVGYDAIPKLLAAADVCLLPFHTVAATEHIVPIKLYEYMAAGKPVIAAPLPGVMRDVGDSNGVTYAPAEKQIEKALALGDEAAAMGKAARAFVEANCDWNVVTDEFERRLEAHSAGRR